MLSKKLSATDKINTLVEHLYDSYKGYEESANTVEDTLLQEKFLTAAKQRKTMISELEKTLIAHNVMPEKHGTMSGVIHRIFVDIKSMLTGRDTSAILREVERGENVLMTSYRDALLATSDPELKRLLQTQLATVEEDVTNWELAET